MTRALDDEQIRNALRRVVDPEIGANIVDLGLIYRIDNKADGLVIEMTMTSPACPMGEMIVDDAHSELARILPDGQRAEIRIVWEPPWTPARMSERCREHLGWESDPT